MKHKLLLFTLVCLFAGCLLLSACGVAGGTPSGTTAAATTTAGTPVANLTFASSTVTYDGTAKTIAVSGLPEGASVVYSVNGGEYVDAVSVTDAGHYLVTAKITLPAGYQPASDMTALLTVEKATLVPAFDGADYFESTTVAYNGADQGPTPKVELPAGITYYYEGAPVRNAGSVGTYTIRFGFADPAKAKNYVVPAALEGVTLTVVKADFDLSGLSFVDTTLPYNDKLQKIPLLGELPAQLKVEIDGARERGTHPVAATFAFKNPADAANYNLPAALTANLTIGKSVYDLSGYRFDDLTLSYSGLNQMPSFREQEGLTITVAVKDATGAVVTEVKNPGEYTVTVSFAVTDTEQYETPADRTFKITVNKAVLNGLPVPEFVPTNGWDHELLDAGYFWQDTAAPHAHGVSLVIPAVLQELIDDGYCDVELVYTHTLNGTATTDLNGVGAYVTTVALNFTSDCYLLPEDYATTYTFAWQVADKTVNMSGITFADATFAYDGAAHMIALVKDASYTYLGDVVYVITDSEGNPVSECVASGTYTIKAYAMTSPESGYAPLEAEAKLTIGQATIDLTEFEFVWNYTDAFVYEAGATYTVALTEDTVTALRALGVTVEGYNGNTANAKGEYTATLVLSCDDNYKISALDESGTLAWGIALKDEDSWSGIVS